MEKRFEEKISEVKGKMTQPQLKIFTSSEKVISDAVEKVCAAIEEVEKYGSTDFILDGVSDILDSLVGDRDPHEVKERLCQDILAEVKKSAKPGALYRASYMGLILDLTHLAGFVLITKTAITF